LVRTSASVSSTAFFFASSPSIIGSADRSLRPFDPQVRALGPAAVQCRLAGADNRLPPRRQGGNSGPSPANSAKWSEINEAAAVWTMPGARTKSGRDHRVPLSEAALAIIAQQRKIAAGEYVFPGAKRGRPLSNMAMAVLLRRMQRDDLTVHGFRSSFRDWAGECTNFPRKVVEAALAHVLKDKTEAAYARGDLFEKRRRLMAAWGKFCSKPAMPARVVALTRV
jgi:integrase